MVCNDTAHVYIDNLPDNSTKHKLDQPPGSDEVINIIKNIQSEKAAGKEEISGEFWKMGVDSLIGIILYLVHAF